MTRFPLRIGRSRSIWEDGSPNEIARKEFPSREGGVDLRPSVYLVTPLETLRATAEHLAQRLNPPIKVGVVELDLSELAPVRESRATGEFEFTNARHAELLLNNEAQLERVVEAVRSGPSRRIVRNREAIIAYMSERLEARDPEWVNQMTRKPRWRDLLGRSDAG